MTDVRPQDRIIYLLSADGFICADLLTGRTAYAYPTSDHWREAKANPSAVATRMLSKENAFRDIIDAVPGHMVAESARLYDASRIATLMANENTQYAGDGR